MLLYALILTFLSIEIYGHNSYEPAPQAPYNPAPIHPPYAPATQPPYAPAHNTQPPYIPPTQPPYAPATHPPYNPVPQPSYAPTPAPPAAEPYGEAALGAAGFPLSSCYTNDDGFMCCNKELENLMDNTYRNLSRSREGKWKTCNLHQVAVATQRNAEKHFGVDFEIVVGAGDFASKNYFTKDMVN
uniref:Ground-like domain-containing protein n=1 Tax=Meloidogyne hapla TaxID=6305 RepID=A0A1I8BUD6_MELHA